MAEVSKKPRRKNTKRTGELSEAAFLHKAVAQGFGVAKPWGDSERYDFILDNGSRLLRVQVKCTGYLRARGYDIQSIHTDRTRKAAYTEKDIDALIAHIVPIDAWYVIPIATCARIKSLRFYPDTECKRARFEKFREAWHLIRS